MKFDNNNKIVSTENLRLKISIVVALFIIEAPIIVSLTIRKAVVNKRAYDITSNILFSNKL